MTTQVRIENINGPDYLIVSEENKKLVLKEGEKIELYVTKDSYITIEEAVKVSE